MLTVIFIVITIILGLAWLMKHISLLSLICYMEKKGYNMPDDNEIKECTRFVLEHLFK